MSNIDQLLASEAASAEAATQGAAPGIRPQGRCGAGSPTVLSVRLTKQQYDALATQAKLAGVPTSALARDMILSSLNSGTADVIAAKLEQVLRHTLNPNMLTP